MFKSNKKAKIPLDRVGVNVSHKIVGGHIEREKKSSSSDILFCSVVVAVAVIGGTFFGYMKSNSVRTLADIPMNQWEWKDGIPPKERSYPLTYEDVRRGENPLITFGALKIKMNATDTGFEAIDSELHERCMKNESKSVWQYAEKNAHTYIKLHSVGGYLSCISRIYQERFCLSKYKREYINLIQSYHDNIKFVNVQLKEMTRGYRGAILEHAQKTESEMMGKQYVSGSSQKRLAFDQRVVSAVLELNRLGYIKKTDFGLVAQLPDEIADNMIKPKTDPCVLGD